MKKSKVFSKNQKGGITAQNVKFGTTDNFNINDVPTEKVSNPLVKTILIVSGIVGFIGSLVTVLAYFSIFPFNK